MRTRTHTIRLVGPIEFSNVSFVFDDDTEVLNNINLLFDAGEHVAITGPSGRRKKHTHQFNATVQRSDFWNYINRWT